MENNYSVYIHTTPNGKVYVGITSKEPEKRWRKNGTGYSSTKHFFSAIQKYGWENIQHEILARNLTKDEACILEKMYIQIYDSTNHEKGYNNTYGGEEGMKNTPEVRKKISQRLTQYRSTEEYKKKASQWMKERKVSEETRKKISEAGRRRHDKWSDGKREAIMAAMKKRYSDPEVMEQMVRRGKELSKYGYEAARKVIQYTESGEEICTFQSMKEAGRKTGIKDGNICKCCKGKTKHAGGYIWRYAD